MKKFFKVSSISALMILTLFLFGGCGTPSPKEFTCSEGLTITLTDNFYVRDIENTSYAICLESVNSIFIAEKNTFQNLQQFGINEDTTLIDYAKSVIASNTILNITPKVDEENNLTYFEYEATESGKDFHYYAVVLKGSDAFWLCQFICETKNTNSLKSNFVTWAKTINVI